MQRVYFVLCIVGVALPLSQFIPWLSVYGLDLPLFMQQAFATPVAAFAWSDLFISAIVLIVFIFVEGRRLAMRHLWLPLAGLLVGVSLALPLFLLLRERHLQALKP